MQKIDDAVSVALTHALMLVSSFTQSFKFRQISNSRAQRMPRPVDRDNNDVNAPAMKSLPPFTYIFADPAVEPIMNVNVMEDSPRIASIALTSNCILGTEQATSSNATEQKGAK